jgi:hypothetical protein
MANDPVPALPLTALQRATLIELGSRGSGGDFDQYALAQLFVLGFVEVRQEDRRIVLTERGRAMYHSLIGGNSDAQ